MYSIESAGNVTIMIKAIGTTSLMGVTYQAGDVVALFDNAYFTLSFVSNNKQITQAVRTMANYNIMAAERLVIEPKSLTHTAYNFIAAKYRDSGTIFVPVQETITSDNSGTAFLNFIPTNSKLLFIKDSNKTNITGYTVDYTTGQITGLTVNTSYICFYYREEERLVSYELNEISTPYFAIEILGENNINNISRKMLITIPKASIDIAAVMDFKEDEITAVQLQFIVIEKNATIDYY
jgi:hypothetical protein